MARRPQPRQITIEGREAVALTVEEYEQLIASRRQIGGQSARVGYSPSKPSAPNNS